ncbi:hypothetical protein ID866_13001 [Astraeus odoratus]|nr:hypothetical protein ID866_13001 [Astraeus odoratus]
MPSVSIPPYNLLNFPALVDSRSTHCFVDKTFLFDGTSNFVNTQAAELPVQFPTSGDVTPMTFYLALLDSDCKIVLGYNWLTKYNLLIDWSMSSITFHMFTEQVPMPPSTPSDSSTPGTNPSSSSAPNPTPSPMPSDPAPDVSGCTPLKAPHISLINTAAFMHTCKLEGSFQFSL